MTDASSALEKLPFLTMLPVQILVNNFLYDVSEIPIPMDSVDREYLERPRHWNMSSIRNFMIAVGLVSSIFDFLTFYVMRHVFHAGEQLFHTGWFVESLATQVLVIFVIRTQGNPFRSRPSSVLAATSLVVVAVATAFQQCRYRGRDRGAALGIEQQRRVAGDLRQGRRVRAGHGHAATHRLEDRQAEALEQRRVDEAVGECVQPLEVGVGDPAREAHASGEAELVDVAQQRLARSAGMPGDDEHGIAGDGREGVDERRQVLVRQGRRHAQQHARVAEVVTRAQIAGRRRRGAAVQAESEPYDVDAVGGDAQTLHDVALRGVRVGQDAPRAARAERDEQT